MLSLRIAVSNVNSPSSNKSIPATLIGSINSFNLLPKLLRGRVAGFVFFISLYVLICYYLSYLYNGGRRCGSGRQCGSKGGYRGGRGGGGGGGYLMVKLGNNAR